MDGPISSLGTHMEELIVVNDTCLFHEGYDGLISKWVHLSIRLPRVENGLD